MSPFFNKNTDSTSGIIYYHIPANTILYRGDSNPNFNPRQLFNSPLFFGLNNEDVEQYGVVYRYKTIVPLQLLALDGPNPQFYDNVPANIKTILNEQYGFNDPERRRNSDGPKDKLLVTYICENGYSGYANDKMNHYDPGRGDFHKEIVICDTRNIEFVKKEDISKELEQSKRDAHLLQKVGNPGRKKSRRSYFNDNNDNNSSSISSSLFTNDMGSSSSLFNSPPSSPTGKLSFGGKRKTRKSKRKTIKKRKSKKGGSRRSRRETRRMEKEENLVHQQVREENVRRIINGDLTNLENVDLQGVNLYGSSLEGANLTGANLKDANLTNANLFATNLTNANLEYTNLEGANLTGANLTGANLEYTNLEGANMRVVNLQGAVHIDDANLNNVILRGTNLQGVNLEGVNLFGADLTGANLQEVNLYESKLQKANLTNANLEGANLEKTDFRGANLQDADLTDVNLNNTIFRKANLNGTIFGTMFDHYGSTPDFRGTFLDDSEEDSEEEIENDTMDVTSSSNPPLTIEESDTEEIMLTRKPIVITQYQPLFSQLSGFDVNLQDDLNYCEYIKEEPDNLLFIHKGQIVSVEKKVLKKMITGETMNKDHIIFQCKNIENAYTPRNSNIIGGPHLNMTSIGIPYVMIPLAEIDFVINNHYQIYIIESCNNRPIPIASLNTRLGGNVVSADFCQALVTINPGSLTYLENDYLFNLCDEKIKKDENDLASPSSSRKRTRNTGGKKSKRKTRKTKRKTRKSKKSKKKI